MRRRYCAEGSWGLQVVTVVKSRRGARPVGETRVTYARSHQVELRNTGKWQRREVTLKLIKGLFGRRRLAHLSQTVKVKFIGITLPMDLRHDVLVVVVAKSAAKFVVVHIGLAFPLTPSSGYFVRVDQFKLPVGTFPCDARHVGTVRQELQEKLPELNLSTS